MDYQWDNAKATSNRRKHGVRFADAVTVFSDEKAITIEDDYLEEERFVTIGIDALGRILVVVYAYRDADIRIISARKATIVEQQIYNGEQ
jgi:uncharacterized DUF497 family protein